jgi:hypothetical protein
MSSFLKSAAMTLLSRMIQALLSKYLVDVDVEGIAFPSMMSGYGTTTTSSSGNSSTNTDSTINNVGGHLPSNGNNSGFGMRLKNVKLRNGAKLMELPGKPPPPNVPKQQQQQHKQQQQQQKQHRKAPSNNDDNNHHTVVEFCHESTETDNQHRHNTSMNFSSTEQKKNSLSFPLSTTVELQELVLYDVEKELSISSSTPLLQPNKLTKKKVSWMSSWFSSSSDNDNNDTEQYDNNKIINQQQLQHHYTTDVPTKPHVRSNIPLDISVNDCENGSPLWIQPSSSSTTTNRTTTNYVSSIKSGSMSTSSAHLPSQSQQEQTDKKNNQNEVEESNQIILQLGDACVIGTLDVRLIKKTIHVLIEDVSLNLDVVRLRNDHVECNSNSTNNNSNGTKSTTTPKDKSAADRVLAENALARFFSLLPNLFLSNARIRLTIRDDYEDDDDDDNNYYVDNNNDNKTTIHQRSNDIGIVEITIDTLTITDGEDFVSKLRSKHTEESQDENDKELDKEDEEGVDQHNNINNDDNESDSDNGSVPKDAKSSISAATISSLYTDETNDFITRRIQTGQGLSRIRRGGGGRGKSDGGITIRVYPPTSMYSQNFVSHRIHRLSKLSNQQEQWARDRFLSESGNIFLRCTGLDLQAQIFVGTKKRQRHRELIISPSSGSLPYNDAILDSMISGCVDYVIPGPDITTIALPPMLQPTESVTLSESDCRDYHDSFTDPGMFDDGGALPSLYNTDANGIQSCRIASIFHKVSRGLLPVGNDTRCLPCEDNVIIWNNPCKVDNGHSLDNSIPLAGLVLHISVKECLEVNADRQNLETVGMILSLFRKPSNVDGSLPDSFDVKSKTNGIQNSDDDDIDDDRSEASGTSARTEGSLFCKSPTRESIVYGQVESSREESNKIIDSNIGFPSYMQPEKIQILGLYIAKLNLRLHCIKDSTNNNSVEQMVGKYNDATGVSYCYWHANASCLTIDMQTLNATEQLFLDIRLDCNYLKVVEYKGMNTRILLDSMSWDKNLNYTLPKYPTGTDSNNSNARSSWPSTAAALMDIPPLFESVQYESRKDHAIQCRYVNIANSLPAKDVVRRYLIVNFKNVNANAPFPIWRQIPEIINEVRATVFGRPVPVSGDKRFDSRLKFSIRSYGGQVYLDPLINAIVPIPIVVDGEFSTSSGFSFQTSIDNTKLNYGTSTKAPVLENSLTLQHLAELPESVRVRILMFLQDLAPLEDALGINNKNEWNPFRRQQNVNHAIVKLIGLVREPKQCTSGKQSSCNQQSTSNGTASINRRERLLTQLSQLDDDTLEYLLKQSTQPT